MLKPISKTRLSGAVTEQLKELILSRQLQPGDRLPAERQLAQELQVSRTSVREALRVLEIQGFITVRSGAGVFVKGLASEILKPLAAWLPEVKESLECHFEARRVIEPSAARFAAQRATPRLVAELRAAHADFSGKLQAADLAGAILADVEFHRLISVGTNNKTLMILMDTIARSLFEGWQATLRVPGRLEKTVAEHGAVLAAIESGDADGAAKAMLAHLEKALDDLSGAGLR